MRILSCASGCLVTRMVVEVPYHGDYSAAFGGVKKRREEEKGGGWDDDWGQQQQGGHH